MIDIVDESNPYPTLLGIDWAIDMNGVINMKKHKMIFKKKSLRVVVLLDLAKGARYIEPVRNDNSDDILDCIYNITTQEEDWVNPTVDGRISWEHESSCTSDLPLLTITIGVNLKVPRGFAMDAIICVSMLLSE